MIYCKLYEIGRQLSSYLSCRLDLRCYLDLFSANNPRRVLVDHRLPVALLDQEQGLVGQPLFDLLALSATVQPIVLADNPTLDDLKKQIEDGELAAVIIIPDGYSAAILTGSNPQLDVIIDTESGAGSTAQFAIQGAVSRLHSVVSAAQFSTQARGVFSHLPMMLLSKPISLPL